MRFGLATRSVILKFFKFEFCWISRDFADVTVRGSNGQTNEDRPYFRRQKF